MQGSWHKNNQINAIPERICDNVLVFRRIEAVGYRCLKEISQELNPFEILVGPNGSGKSAFLDVIQLLGDFVRYGLSGAILRRSPTFQDLVWSRQGGRFRFRADLNPPGDLRKLSYTVSFVLDGHARGLAVSDESATVVRHDGSQAVMARSGDVVQYTSEFGQEVFTHRANPNFSAVPNFPTDDAFPSLAWLREFFMERISVIKLDPKELATPSPPERALDFVNAGASLAWQIPHLQDRNPAAMEAWTAHVRTALPDVCRIESVLQSWDSRRFAALQYKNGIQVPSWLLSEGTLRLLALTILAYLPDVRGTYLVEEVENGVHPAAVETIQQSLSSIYGAQVLVSTHSPVLLSMAVPEQILCFSKTPEGTKIIRGNEHPALKDWQGEVSLGTMVASGILS